MNLAPTPYSISLRSILILPLRLCVGLKSEPFTFSGKNLVCTFHDTNVTNRDVTSALKI